MMSALPDLLIRVSESTKTTGCSIFSTNYGALNEPMNFQGIHNQLLSIE